MPGEGWCIQPLHTHTHTHARARARARAPSGSTPGCVLYGEWYLSFSEWSVTANEAISRLQCEGFMNSPHLSVPQNETQSLWKNSSLEVLHPHRLTGPERLTPRLGILGFVPRTYASGSNPRTVKWMTHHLLDGWRLFLNVPITDLPCMTPHSKTPLLFLREECLRRLRAG